MKNNILILTGGRISIPFAKEYIKKFNYDTVIAVDRGLAYAKELSVPIDYIVGDFDSVDKRIMDEYIDSDIKIMEYNPEKDATDTELALELSLELMAEEVTILGASGSRIDHTLANINLLYNLLKKKVKASIVDEWNKVYLIEEDTTLNKDLLHGPYLSILPFMDTVKGVYLTGFKYPLANRTMYPYSSLGISNEIIDNTANIRLQSGILIVIEAKD
ncbi:MAG: hypothetical protein K0S61_19 [Anaerocolumna sp.]|jgi:thiamine pyrophosphokinase|nr:hypothetical protein [Anaerocolumna sp.]